MPAREATPSEVVSLARVYVQCACMADALEERGAEPVTLATAQRTADAAFLALVRALGDHQVCNVCSFIVTDGTKCQHLGG